jgi:autotransporter-associated beta strand protein
MKKHIIDTLRESTRLVWLWLAASCVAAPPPGYYLVWGDEFNGTSLDTTKWDYWLPGRRRDAVNVTNAVSVSGGYLTITTYTSNNTHYSGFVATDRKFRTKYGYWESSIKWGDTNGMWSAFWMQSPTMGRYLRDPQTAGSEIDIAEHRWVDGSTNPVANRVQVNIHWNGYGSSARGAGSGYVGNGLADGFHVYGFLSTPASYSFLIDGARVYDGGSAPISHSAEFAILSSEVDETSTTWAGFIPAGGYGSLADSTTKLTVDYVRYYAPTSTVFWIGGSSTYWTNADNWVSNMIPAAASDVTFSCLGSGARTELGREFSVHGLTILDTEGTVSVWGHSLTIGEGGIDAICQSATLDCDVVADARQTWTVGPGRTLRVNGALTGRGVLAKAGAGTLILSNAAEYAGTFEVLGGTLRVNGVMEAPVIVPPGGVVSNRSGVLSVVAAPP